ncbi:MAG: hypothetical protein RBR02_09485 [Desulfuromonadaceae bacterium]|nr:hypothetical protein [Desulfuromonadaceae bacterium]
MIELSPQFIELLSPFDMVPKTEEILAWKSPIEQEPLMYDPIPPGSMSPISALAFLRQNKYVIRSYCMAKAPNSVYDIHYLVEDFIKFALENPVAAFEIIYDFLVPNEIKIQWIKDYLFKKPRIINIIGERGSGKNVMTYQLFEWAMEYGLLPYIIGASQKAHESVNIASDLFDVPCRTISSIDELAIFYNSRTRESSATEDTTSFAVARHHLKWIVSAVQISSTGDINFLKFCDMLIMKSMSLFSLSLERDAIMELVPNYFIPKDQKTAFFMCPDFRCTVELGLPKMWNESYSIPFSILDKNKKEQVICDMLNSGTRPDMIAKTLVARSVRCTEKEVIEILKKMKE